MLHQTLINTNNSAADMCAKLQPNSRLWQIETGIQSGMTGNGFCGFAMRLSTAQIGCPSATLNAFAGKAMIGFDYTGELGVDQPRASMRSFVTGERQPVNLIPGGSAKTTYQDTNGNFNKPYSSGKLSRRDGWPPPQVLATGSGSCAGPGGGSTAAD